MENKLDLNALLKKDLIIVNVPPNFDFQSYYDLDQTETGGVDTIVLEKHLAILCTPQNAEQVENLVQLILDSENEDDGLTLEEFDEIINAGIKMNKSIQ